ncbi:AAA family ATPase [Brachyspira hyodysenteriae]|uniref:AAA family ATPase n=1 Tax=Brachyspira hyodysenteriae TaxID=159 RepID=UPI00036EF910|nr:AAA family ATPase [Brachyspira hyodysenteriae]MCZ9838779.1 AAA family ATPase [Brachyspira hyodysenteriae]MCZ9848068.1 AAA family ATPase [Brachyspira hyodysenteriae]MCZ9851885.1 AAA family ATPase [Brachyspira hyodysenteriae]MCZ9859377.1 AAA family ATPase [Brachyspira hyodysenteriae]MCZ9870601.1 AAA family ATPase [Brachyspira hyodysenteriae]
MTDNINNSENSNEISSEIANASKDLQAISEASKMALDVVNAIKNEIKKVIIGQENMLDKLLLGIICDGHVLLEGVPGLAKTLTVKSLASTIDASYKRIQFTPDLLPADIVGTEIYDIKNSVFLPKQGPIFSNIILADEINRSPAKVQSALLEAMGEHQVTIGDKTYRLPDVFLVLATQNPIEQEGTYPLPEAQVDRFMLKVIVKYPTKSEEKTIIKNMSSSKPAELKPITTIETIEKLRKLANQIHIEERLIDYIVNIIDATRNPKDYKLQSEYIEYGASPRAGIYLTKAAKANAMMQGRGFVMPEDIRAVAYEVLRHRISVSYEAQAENVNSDMIIENLLANINVP